PQVGQPISCQGVETVTVTSILVRWTASTWTSEMPRSVSQRAQGSVVGASLHPVALVNVEVLGTNGCLVATDHRGPRPLPALNYPPRVPLPTGSPKSRFADEVGALGVGFDVAGLSSVGRDAPLVEVAEGCAGDGAAAGGLLVHTLEYLGAQVLGVELVDRGDDAVHESTDRALVDDLG